MLIELSQLPPSMQQHILSEKTDIVQIVNNGQVIKNLQFSEPTNDINDDFDFDLERMKKAMQGLETPEDIAKNTVAIPKSALQDLATFKQFLTESFV